MRTAPPPGTPPPTSTPQNLTGRLVAPASAPPCSPVTSAIQVLEDLQEIAVVVSELDAAIASPTGRAKLARLLERDFEPDLKRPGSRLWLDSVAEDILNAIMGQHRDAVELIAGALGVLTGRDEIWAAFLCLDCKIDTLEIGEYY